MGQVGEKMLFVAILVVLLALWAANKYDSSQMKKFYKEMDEHRKTIQSIGPFNDIELSKPIDQAYETQFKEICDKYNAPEGSRKIVLTHIYNVHFHYSYVPALVWRTDEYANFLILDETPFMYQNKISELRRIHESAITPRHEFEYDRLYKSWMRLNPYIRSIFLPYLGDSPKGIHPYTEQYVVGVVEVTRKSLPSLLDALDLPRSAYRIKYSNLSETQLLSLKELFPEICNTQNIKAEIDTLIQEGKNYMDIQDFVYEKFCSKEILESQTAECLNYAMEKLHNNNT